MEVDANKIIEIYKRRVSEMDYQLICYELTVQGLEAEIAELKKGQDAIEEEEEDDE